MTRTQRFGRLSAAISLVLPLLLLGAAALPAVAAEAGLAGKLQQFVDSNTLAGAVTLVASKDKTLDVGAVGFADIAARKPMRPDSMFWIASMTKPITAAGVMILVDEGKIKLDDPVEKYLPEFHGQMVAAAKGDAQAKPQPPVHPITVRECLSHTSGLPFMPPKAGNKVDLISLKETVLAAASGPLNFQPGSKYDYSNAGIDTAGRIIEVVSGMPYDQFMQKRLFDPLGMKDTTMWPSEEQVARLAKCYHSGPGGKGLAEGKVGHLTYPLSDHNRGVSPGGGLFATAADVAAFGRMVLGGGMFEGKRLLSEAAVREMTSTQTGKLLDKEKGEGGYGLGFSTTRRSAGASAPAAEASPLGGCGHGGACATDFWVDPQQQLVTVYMVQHQGYGGPDGGKILPTFRKAANEAFGKK
jgi:CubicO group peptidase (beta-lactamase class C family)